MWDLNSKVVVAKAEGHQGISFVLYLVQYIKIYIYYGHPT